MVYLFVNGYNITLMGGSNMKKTLLAVTFLIFLVGLSVAASAAVSLVDTFDASKPLLGGRTQRASNPEHDDANTKPELVNTFDDGSFALSNNGTSAVTITDIKFASAAGFSINDVQLSWTSKAFTSVPASGSLNVDIRGRIPQSLDAVDTNLKEAAFQVATANVELSDGSLVTVPVFMQRQNILFIDDIDVTINGKNRQSIDDNDDIDQLKPGDNLDFDIELENIIEEDSNLDIDDVEPEVSCTDETDFDIEDADDVDVNADETESTDLQIDIDEDAEDGTTRCNMEAVGRDNFGARHGHAISFDIEVERESHDIVIRGISVIPDQITCSDKSFQVNVDYINLGRSDEDEVAVEVEGRVFNFLKKITNRELDEDDSDTEIFDIPIPEGLEPGVHVLQVRTFYDTTRASDSEVVQVENLCGAEEETEVPGFEPGTGALTLTRTSFIASPGSSVSIPVQLRNTMSGFRTFTITLENADEFVDPVSSKVLSLNAGQSSTVFLNVKMKSGVAEGDYSAAVNVETSGSPVATEVVSFKVSGEAEKASTGNFVGSRAFWVALDIVLVLVALYFIWMIFRRRA